MGHRALRRDKGGVMTDSSRISRRLGGVTRGVWHVVRGVWVRKNTFHNHYIFVTHHVDSIGNGTFFEIRSARRPCSLILWNNSAQRSTHYNYQVFLTRRYRWVPATRAQYSTTTHLIVDSNETGIVVLPLLVQRRGEDYWGQGDRTCEARSEP